MDTKDLLAVHFHRDDTPAKASKKPKETVVFTPEQRRLTEALTQRIAKLIWHDSNNLDGHTLPLDWVTSINDGGVVGKRTVDASPWIDIDKLEDGKVVQTQLQTWRDQVDHYSEGGAYLPFSSAEGSPIPSIWLRVRSADAQLASEPEELFRFPAYDLMFLRGHRVVLEPEHFAQAFGLVADIEAWRSK